MLYKTSPLNESIKQLQLSDRYKEMLIFTPPSISFGIIGIMSTDNSDGHMLCIVFVKAYSYIIFRDPDVTKRYYFTLNRLSFHFVNLTP